MKSIYSGEGVLSSSSVGVRGVLSSSSEGLGGSC